MTDYELDLAHAVANTSFTAGELGHTLSFIDWHKVPVIVETPNGPLAIGHLAEHNGVITLFTLEG